ncbi:hypothetical protein JOC94_000595 [Bacillus thermophilus]|uniref:Uncharacterized protein n=1 Tax=Siminovitchia thermophila TaxID=1245522 RepID=A0ABS2R4S9_9BACI|nr:hypothetical protein [Siminovitchia thermophila]
MLVERIGHLGAVFSHSDLLYSLKILKWEFYGTLHACRDKWIPLYHTQTFSVVKIGRLLRE